MTTSSELATKILDAVATKKTKQKVLEEDEYLNVSQNIIKA